MTSDRHLWPLIAISFSALPVFPAVAADCGCADVSAESYSDSGTCIVNESNSNFCTLDWRHGMDTTAPSEGIDDQVENRTNSFIRFALGGNISEGSLFSKPDAWAALQNYASNANTKLTYKGAATYLERTYPKEYDLTLALTSMASLIGSSVSPDDKFVPAVLLEYMSRHEDEIFEGITGRKSGDIMQDRILDADVTGVASFGCLELNAVRQPPDTGASHSRILLKTAHATPGARCQP